MLLQNNIIEYSDDLRHVEPCKCYRKDTQAQHAKFNFKILMSLRLLHGVLQDCLLASIIIMHNVLGQFITISTLTFGPVFLEFLNVQQILGTHIIMQE